MSQIFRHNKRCHWEKAPVGFGVGDSPTGPVAATRYGDASSRQRTASWTWLTVGLSVVCHILP